jgi:hypothetical protein
MASRSMGYDHPAYLARLAHAFPVTSAGSGAVTGKFTAFANLQILALVATPTAMGTSTYANLWNGTATISTAVGAQTVAVIRVFNTAAAGATPALGTATYGPFVLSLYDGTSTNTQTSSAKPGFTNYIPLYGSSTGTGTTTGVMQAGTATGAGGFSVNQGDALYCVQGTDATSIGCYALEYAVTPLASVTV